MPAAITKLGESFIVMNVCREEFTHVHVKNEFGTNAEHIGNQAYCAEIDATWHAATGWRV
jgi:hypothetical protein